MLESKIEKDVSKYAESLGWLAYKWSSPSTKGVPDHLYFKEGCVVAIEFKQEGKKATKLQEYHIKRLRKQCFVVVVIDSVAGGVEFFNEYDRRFN